MAADLLLENGLVYPLVEPTDTPADPVAQRVAIADGHVIAVGANAARVSGTRTKTIDLDDRTVLPGFIDAHTHLVHEGLSSVHANLAPASSREDALDRLQDHAERRPDDDSWIIGVGYDESTWPTGVGPSRADLDEIAVDRPVAVVRVDMHTAVINSTVFERFGDRFADEHVRTEGDRPTGVIVEDALQVIEPVFSPSIEHTRRLIERAVDRATGLGITGVHDKVGPGHAPRVYRELERDCELDIRVRIDYWWDYLDAIIETGLMTNHGSNLVTVGAIKTFTDGSIGARTARLHSPYEDVPGTGRGQWVVEPGTFRDMVERATGARLQIAAHAIGDEAIDLAVDLLSTAPGERHRIEHAELATDDAIERMAKAGLVASMQPNFHRWAVEDGLYETALGLSRTRRTNRIRTMLDAGVPLAFGSDCMPMDPLGGIHHAVTARTDAQSLSVTEAIRAYTVGAAYAGFDEDRLGTIEVGKSADLVILEDSPWDQSHATDDIEVAVTLVDGRIVHDAR